MVANFFNWQLDHFFTAAETVQESADRLELNYRNWLRLLEADAGVQEAEQRVLAEGKEIQRLQLVTLCDTVTWQLEEFGRAIRKAGKTDGASARARRLEFVEIIGNQVAAVRKGLLDWDQKHLREAAAAGRHEDTLASFLAASERHAEKSASGVLLEPALELNTSFFGGAADTPGLCSATDRQSTSGGTPTCSGSHSRPDGAGQEQTRPDGEADADDLQARWPGALPSPASSDGSWEGGSFPTSSSASSESWEDSWARSKGEAADADMGFRSGPAAGGALAGRGKEEPGMAGPAVLKGDFLPQAWNEGHRGETAAAFYRHSELDPEAQGQRIGDPVKEQKGGAQGLEGAGWRHGSRLQGSSHLAAAEPAFSEALVERASAAVVRVGKEAGVVSYGSRRPQPLPPSGREGWAPVLVPAAFRSYWGAALKKRQRDAEGETDLESGVPVVRYSSDCDREEVKELVAGSWRSPRLRSSQNACAARVTGLLRPCLCWGLQGCVVLALCVTYISLSPAHWSSVT